MCVPGTREPACSLLKAPRVHDLRLASGSEARGVQRRVSSRRVAGVAPPDGSGSTHHSQVSGELYDEAYFATHCGSVYTRGTGRWEAFFGHVADEIVRRLKPRRVLDAGCAIGFLLEALRDRGVAVEGFDISEYAIMQVPDELREFVWVASVTDELASDYDLIVCIEVLEHVTEEQARTAIANFARHTDRILFSSTPDDRDEPTHINVQPADYWAELFAEHGFFREISVDADFVSVQAVLFRRQAPTGFAAAVEGLERERKGYVAQLNQERDEHLALLEQERKDHGAQLELEREHAAEELAQLQEALSIAQQEVDEWHAWQQRGGFRIFVALVRLRVVVAPPGSLRDRVLRTGLRGVARVLDRVVTRSTEPRPVVEDSRKAVLFLSGCPGDAYRYRGEHQAAELELAGGTADSALVGTVDLGIALDSYAAFVLHRVAWDKSFERFVELANERRKPVIFDTDDLVFVPEAMRFVAALDDMSSTERELYEDGVRRYRETLSVLRIATVSTESLREAAADVADRVLVVPNAVSDEMVHLADAALVARVAHPSGDLTIAYLSGTPTHNRDFLEAADAVLWALERYAFVKFMAVGHLQLDERFDRFGARVDHVPLQPWQRLPELLARVDINLAPLEPANPFTDAKSCLKYLEAGLVAVPTVASARPDFVRVIEHEKNGLLADTPGEWQQALQLLIDSPERRHSIGAAAYEDVRARHTVRAQARSLHGSLAKLVARGDDDPLAINWIVRAPIAKRGGGYRTIFRLANELGRQGHHVRVYVEPIAHLEGMPKRRITSFVEEEFGPLQVEVEVGHAEIASADVTIATNWPTALTVAAHQKSLFKAYFVQDYEPEFYAESDPWRQKADATYDLALRHITYGRHLASRIEARTGVAADALDFALEPVFETRVPPDSRSGPPRVIFLARPDQPRRGFDLGVAALERLYEQHPEVEIRLFGCSDEELPRLPFPITNLGIVSTEELASVLNESHICLSFSQTNISHAPYEAMACGCAVVELDLPQVRSMLSLGTAALAEPNPVAVAEALRSLIENPEMRIATARRGIEATSVMTWDRTARQLQAVLRELAFVCLQPS
jgi:glycosyltransferase involved in cell wall biosynthesis/SAM-dependent methyltransferase